MEQEKLEVSVGLPSLDGETDEKVESFSQFYTTITDKIVKSINTKTIRPSYEYDLIVLFCKNVLMMNSSTYFSEYNLSNNFKLELHHEPFTLFDITDTVCRKQLKENGKFSDMSVAEEVIRLHFEMKVGLMPVDPTTHELIHSQSLIVHPDIPQGNWEQFIKEYKEFMSDDLLEKVSTIEYLKKNEKVDKYPEILKQKVVTIKNNKIEKLLSLELPNLIEEKK